MSEFPSELQAVAMGLIVGQRSPAWVRLDAEGRVLLAGGDLQAHGLPGLRPGALAVREVGFLEGLLPVPGGGPLVLEQVSLLPHRFTDVYLMPDPEGTWVLLLDTTDTTRREWALHQKSNEFDLLREALGGVGAREAATRSIEAVDVLGYLGMAILIVDEVGDLRPVGPPPDWMLPRLEADPKGYSRLAVGDGLSFLDNFLEDAEEHWERGEVGMRRSGTWSEQGPSGQEQFLEAFALVGELGRSVLAIELLEDRYVERQSLLQAARETSLSYHSLLSEIQKKEVLLHCIVHDLRSPLSSLVGGLSLMLSRRLSEERQRSIVELSLRQARKQDDMIRQVLAVFASEVEELEKVERDPRRAPDFVAVTRDVVDQYRMPFQSAGVELVWIDEDQCSERLPVMGRDDRLERVLRNLLDNALRHSPSKGRVDVSLREMDGMVTFRVLDRGPGVPAELESTLFERFAQGPGQRGMAGLGLYFCSITARKWGGEVGYSPREGGGSEFRFALPLLIPTE